MTKRKKDTQDGLLWESPIGKRRVMMVVSSLDGKRKLFHDSNHKKYHHPICVSHHSFTLMKAINNKVLWKTSLKKKNKNILNGKKNFGRYIIAFLRMPYTR